MLLWRIVEKFLSITGIIKYISNIICFTDDGEKNPIHV